MRGHLRFPTYHNEWNLHCRLELQMYEAKHKSRRGRCELKSCHEWEMTTPVLEHLLDGSLGLGNTNSYILQRT